MITNDPIFGELEYKYGWSKDTTIHFFGKETEVALMIDGEEDGELDKEQYVAYQSLMQNWEQVQQSLMQPILDYYQQKRHDSGLHIDDKIVQ